MKYLSKYLKHQVLHLVLKARRKSLISELKWAEAELQALRRQIPALRAAISQTEEDLHKNRVEVLANWALFRAILKRSPQ